MRLRGVVHCMDCQKPRCIYSSQAIAKLKPPDNDHTREEKIDCRCVCGLFSLICFTLFTSSANNFSMAYGRYIAKHALEDGVNFDLYICGMQPLEEFKPCHEILQCDPSLSCATPIDADLYAMSRPYMPSSIICIILWCSVLWEMGSGKWGKWEMGLWGLWDRKCSGMRKFWRKRRLFDWQGL